MSNSPPAVSVVIATRNRSASLRNTLTRLRELPEQPPVIVVDNGSSDDTVASVRAHFPEVKVIALGENLGSGARNVGVARAGTPHVAFADDDSWWAAGSLARAVGFFEAHPPLALIAARVLVGPGERLDPTCLEMAASPLPGVAGLPGPAVLGFLACGSIVRRSAFLAVGGFPTRFGIGGEEELVAIDLAATGCDLAYVESVVAHHHPSPSRDPEGRRRTQLRNALWCAWLRRPGSSAVRRTVRLLRPFFRDRATRAGFLAALRGLGHVLRERRTVPPKVEHALRLLER